MFNKLFHMKHFILLSSVIFGITIHSHAEQMSYTDFSGGLCNDVSADIILSNESPDCKNVIVSEKGTSLEKRKGFSLYKTLTDSATFGGAGIAIFRDQTTGNDYFIVAHGTMVSKVSLSSTVVLATDNTANTFTDFTQSDDKIYGCNGTDSNWYYDGTTFTRFASTEPITYTHAFYQNRYWVASSSTTPNKIWHSYFNDPTDFSTTLDFANPNKAADNWEVGASGERITKLFPYGGALFVFKEKSIYMVVGTETPFEQQELTHSLGCRDPNSIVEDSGILYFLGNDNYYYAYDGSQLVKLSEKIQGTMDNISTAIFLSTGSSVSTDYYVTEDTIADWDLGTSSNVYISHDDKLLRAKILDTFSDGNFTGWTELGTGSATISVRANPFHDNDNYNYVGLQNQSDLEYKVVYKNIGAIEPSTLGTWYFDVKVTTYVTTSNPIAWIIFASTLPTGGTSSFSYSPDYCAIYFTAIYEPTLKLKVAMGFNILGEIDTTYTSTPFVASGNLRVKITVTSASGGRLNWNVSTLNEGETIFISHFNKTTPTSSTMKYLLLQVRNLYSTTPFYFTNIYQPLPIADNSTFISKVSTTTTSSYSFLNFDSNDALNSGNINYFMRSDASASTILTKDWTGITNNTTIPITEATYVQWKASFTATSPAYVPEVDDISIGYNITNVNPSIVYGVGSSIIYKSKLYFACRNVLLGTESYNNSFMVYDLLTGSWWYNTGVYAQAWTTLNNDLYYVDARRGILLKQASVYNDYNLTVDTAIDAYWYSRLEYMQNPFIKKDLKLLGVAMKKQNLGSLLLDYLVHGITADTITYSQVTTEPSIVRLNRYPQGQKGYYFQWKLYNSTASVPFEIYNLMTEYSTLPMEVSQ